MAKAKKEEKNSKPRVKISFLKALLILLGADLILLLAPGIGLLNSAFYIGDMISWPAVIIGMILLALGFRGGFRQE
jgi:Ca2+/Na+ antiporter